MTMNFDELERRAHKIIGKAARHTARRGRAIQQDMLDFSAPGLTDIVPPLALAQFKRASQPIVIPADTPLWTSLCNEGIPIDIEFRTTASAIILPIDLTHVTFDPLNFLLTLEIENKSDRDWCDLQLNELGVYCFAIDDPHQQNRALRIVDAVIAPGAAATIRAAQHESDKLPVVISCPWRDKRQLTPARYAQTGMMLLREFLVQPSAFASFLVTGFSNVPRNSGKLWLEIYAPRLGGLQFSPSNSDFRLHVVPTVARRPYRSTLVTSVARPFTPLANEQGHCLINVQSVQINEAEGHWKELKSQNDILSVARDRRSPVYAIVRGPLANMKAKLNKQYLHLIEPNLSPDSKSSHTLHVLGTQCPSVSLLGIERLSFKTSAPTSVALCEAATPLYRPPRRGVEQLVRTYLAVGNPLWSNSAASAANALRQLVQLYGLTGWHVAREDLAAQSRQQRWVQYLTSTIVDLVVAPPWGGGDDHLSVNLSLNDASSIPMVLFGHVLADCLSWLTLGQPVKVTLQLSSGSILELPARYKGKDV